MEGPNWLTISQSQWPKQLSLSPIKIHNEEKEVCLATTCRPVVTIMPFDHYSTFSRLQRVTVWIFQFVNNCRNPGNSVIRCSYLSVDELSRAERYWITISQSDSFPHELCILQSDNDVNLPNNSALKSLNPFLDPLGIIRVGGRISKAKLSYSRVYPIILHGKHPIVRLIVLSEHCRILHAGPSLLSASISLRFHIINLRRTVRLITRECVICKRYTGKTAFNSKVNCLKSVSLLAQYLRRSESIMPGCSI